MADVYAKTLVPGAPAVPGLVGTTREAPVLVPQLLQRGWAVFGEPPPRRAVGELVISADRLRLLVAGQVLLDDANPAGPDGWWAAVDGLAGRCVVIVCAADDLDLAAGHAGEQLAGLRDTGRAVFAALPVRTELPG